MNFPYEVNIITKKASLDIAQAILKMEMPEINYTRIRPWLNANCKGDFTMAYHTIGNLSVLFESHADAVHFKLVFSEYCSK